jgi:hypothetical protein
MKMSIDFLYSLGQRVKDTLTNDEGRIVSAIHSFDHTNQYLVAFAGPGHPVEVWMNENRLEKVLGADEAKS